MRNFNSTPILMKDYMIYRKDVKRFEKAHEEDSCYRR